MAISIKKKFRSYEQLRMKLKRNNIENPGRVSRLLLENFLSGEANISAEEVEARKICDGKRGSFADWRDELNQKGWLEWSKFSGYQPGQKLLPMINREKISTKELATKDELNRGLAQNRSEIDELRKTMDRILDIIDPPSGPAKRKKLSNGGYDNHLQLIRQKDGSI